MQMQVDSAQNLYNMGSCTSSTGQRSKIYMPPDPFNYTHDEKRVKELAAAGISRHSDLRWLHASNRRMALYVWHAPYSSEESCLDPDLTGIGVWVELKKLLQIRRTKSGLYQRMRFDIAEWNEILGFKYKEEWDWDGVKLPDIDLVRYGMADMLDTSLDRRCQAALAWDSDPWAKIRLRMSVEMRKVITNLAPAVKNNLMGCYKLMAVIWKHYEQTKTPRDACVKSMLKVKPLQSVDNLVLHGYNKECVERWKGLCRSMEYLLLNEQRPIYLHQVVYPRCDIEWNRRALEAGAAQLLKRTDFISEMMKLKIEKRRAERQWKIDYRYREMKKKDPNYQEDIPEYEKRREAWRFAVYYDRTSRDRDLEDISDMNRRMYLMCREVVQNWKWPKYMTPEGYAEIMERIREHVVYPGIPFPKSVVRFVPFHKLRTYDDDVTHPIFIFKKLEHWQDIARLATARELDAMENAEGFSVVDFMAANGEDLKLAYLLLRGCKVTDTTLQLAKENGHERCVHLLTAG